MVLGQAGVPWSSFIEKQVKWYFFPQLYLVGGLLHDNFFNSTMAQPASKQIMDVLVASETTSRNFFQNFQYQHHIITHEHRIEVELTTQKGQPLKINNHFATLKDNTMYKLTQIYLENRIIKIIDTFTTVNTSQPQIVQQESESVKQGGKNYSRRQLLNKKYHGNFQNQNQSDNKLRDTKNLVKNTIRLFQTWLEERSETGGDVYRQLLEMTKGGKFNNNLIINISKNNLVRRAFLQFCQTNAENLISKSKIHDKNSHFEAMKKYQNLCIEEEDISQEQAEKNDESDRSVKQLRMERIAQQQ